MKQQAREAHKIEMGRQEAAKRNHFHQFDGLSKMCPCGLSEFNYHRSNPFTRNLEICPVYLKDQYGIEPKPKETKVASDFTFNQFSRINRERCESPHGFNHT